MVKIEIATSAYETQTFNKRISVYINTLTEILAPILEDLWDMGGYDCFPEVGYNRGNTLVFYKKICTPVTIKRFLREDKIADQWRKITFAKVSILRAIESAGTKEHILIKADTPIMAEEIKNAILSMPELADEHFNIKIRAGV